MRQAWEPALRRRTTNTAPAPIARAAPLARASCDVAEDEPVAARLPLTGLADAPLWGSRSEVAGSVVLGLASSTLPGLLPAAAIRNS